MSNLSKYGDERNAAVRTMVEDFHAFAVPLEGVKIDVGELPITGPVRVTAADPSCDLLTQDFTAFLERMGVSVNPEATAAGFRVVFDIDPSLRARPRLARVIVEPDRLSFTAGSVRGLWLALAWAERTMASRHAPILPRGDHTIDANPHERIATSMFAAGFEDPSDTDAYSDDALRHMALLGYSSYFLYLNLWEFSVSQLIPELTDERAEQRRQALRQLVDRSARFGLELVLMINAPRFAADHRVFQAHPQLLGGIVMRTSGHALCTSQPLTRELFAEQAASLCSDVPGIGALSMLIGGEGFVHCYTRPNPRTDRVTNCPRCRDHRPSALLLPLLNAITAAVRQASPTTRVMFWPYSSYIWQSQPAEIYDWKEDHDIIAGLDSRASWIHEMEKDHVFDAPGVGRTTVSDYAIHFTGPSPKLLAQKRLLDNRCIEWIAKTETCIDASFNSVPYIPAMQLWLARHRAIQHMNAPVSWEMWRFHGFWPAPSIELAFWVSTEPSLTDQQILSRVAERIYGQRASSQVIAAWQRFSDAWATMYRHYGTYWSGPFVLGPAHPFDMGEGFTNPRSYGEGFFEIVAGLRESESAAFLNDPRNVLPRFITSPSPHYPQHLHDVERSAQAARDGADILRRAMGVVPGPLLRSAQADADNADVCVILLEEDVRFHKFVHLRDRVRYLAATDPERSELTSQLITILRAGIAAAEQALQIMKRSPLIGWGYTFGVRFNQRMVQEKIDKTTALLRRLES